MSVKVKELKVDAVLQIKVNTSFYNMVKGLSYYLFTNIPEQDKEQYIKETLKKEYVDMDDLQKSFYTTALLLAEIERVAIDENLYEEKEISETKVE